MSGDSRGQMQLPFGMIFSVFLIVVFVVVAIIAITVFLDLGENAEAGGFTKELSKEVTRLWRADYGEEYIFEGKLSSKVDYVCFYNSSAASFGFYSDLSNEFKVKADGSGNPHNFYLYPQKVVSVSSVYIAHVDMEEFDKNPYCIARSDDEFRIKLEKLREPLVRVSEVE